MFGYTGSKSTEFRKYLVYTVYMSIQGLVYTVYMSIKGLVYTVYMPIYGLDRQVSLHNFKNSKMCPQYRMKYKMYICQSHNSYAWIRSKMWN